MAAPVLYAALVLEIPEFLATTPATTAAIAEHAHIAATRVQALMAGLVALDVVERDADRRYHLTALGDLLRPTSSPSLTDEILFTGQAMVSRLWRIGGGTAGRCRSL